MRRENFRDRRIGFAVSVLYTLSFTAFLVYTGICLVEWSIRTTHGFPFGGICYPLLLVVMNAYRSFFGLSVIPFGNIGKKK